MNGKAGRHTQAEGWAGRMLAWRAGIGTKCLPMQKVWQGQECYSSWEEVGKGRRYMGPGTYMKKAEGYTWGEVG